MNLRFIHSNWWVCPPLSPTTNVQAGAKRLDSVLWSKEQVPPPTYCPVPTIFHWKIQSTMHLWHGDRYSRYSTLTCFSRKSQWKSTGLERGMFPVPHLDCLKWAHLLRLSELRCCVSVSRGFDVLNITINNVFSIKINCFATVSCSLHPKLKHA